MRRTGGKAILLINRRGWSTHLACRSCGRAWECPDCDVSLVLHRSGALHCHHCGHTEPKPQSCPDCGSVTIAQVGAGTQRVESELAGLLDPLEVFRLDSDSAGGGHAELLSRFERADSGVLVGTQMVAKGHDFPEVTLGVVLDADGSLRMPDFRSEERTFALITQLAGRSGRGAAGGRVLVQAMAPEASSIRRAAKHDAAGFLAEELERRRELRYPPYSPPDRGRCSPRPTPSASTERPMRCANWSPSAWTPASTCSARRPCSGCGASTAAGCC